MKLTQVTGKPFGLTCIRCGKKKQTDLEQCYADTEGTPFRAYYCNICAHQVAQQKGIRIK